MKKQPLLTGMFLIASITASATVHTVSNDPSGGSQYSSLQSAYNAASDDDTLLLEGTNIVYTISGCGQVFTKPLTIIGIGFNPQKQNPKKTYIGPTACQSEFFLAASNSKFYGIEFTYEVRLRGTTSGFLFEDCKFNGNPGFSFDGNSASNAAFINCIFDCNSCRSIGLFGTGSIVSNIQVSNCVFDGYIDGSGNPFASFLIDHCVFLDGSFSGLHYATIANCIFMNLFPDGTGSAMYINNLCRVAGTFPPTGLGSNTGSGNINSTDPMFVNVPPDAFYSTSLDFHLQGGSPAIGAGGDLTDIGVHGGTSNFSEQGEVLINPIMRQVIINNTSVPSNGTLNVQIDASKPDDD